MKKIFHFPSLMISMFVASASDLAPAPTTANTAFAASPESEERRPTRDHSLETKNEMLFPIIESHPSGAYQMIRASGVREELGFSVRQNPGFGYVETMFDFSYRDHSRQDLHLRVAVPKSRDSQTPTAYFYFFPRLHLPYIRTDGETTETTLPNGEKILFDARTGFLKKGGALEQQGAEGAPLDNPEQLQYAGEGVMIRIQARGRDPRLVSSLHATITKKGAPACQVPAAQLWTSSENRSGGRVYFRFATDAELETFLKKRCKF